MNQFPTPPPDRRLQPQRSYTILNKDDSNITHTTENGDKEKLSRFQSMNMVKFKHIEDMRNNIQHYSILKDKKLFLNFPTNIPINNCNIILFGPSGSGKSSFIKTLFRAIYNSPILPPDAINKLVIKNTNENEGTMCLTNFYLKEVVEGISSGISICDTRGQIWMNDKEKEQLKVIIDGKVKDNYIIEQRSNRQAYLLWEFWKKDSELFPEEIFKGLKPGLASIPHSVVLIFDGSIDKIIEDDDEKFYKEIVELTHKKGYQAVHVILTRLDIFEKKLNEKNKNIHPSERIALINSIKDQQIEKIMNTLGVKRTHVHFIENYHSSENSIIEIDYDALKTLSDIINLAEQFILNYLNKNTGCFNRCFS